MIVGIDYSMTSPAVCCCVGEFNYENCSFMFVTNNKKKEGSWSPKIKGIPLYEYKDNTERFTKLANITMEFILSHPTAHIHTHDIAIEGYAFGAKGQVFNIGENTGILKFFLKRLNQELSVYAPSEIKKFATGKGNAKKELMYESFIEETGDDLAKLFGIDEYKGQGPVSDIIDSYYIAKYHHKLLNS
jgi:hypothetical protein